MDEPWRLLDESTHTAVRRACCDALDLDDTTFTRLAQTPQDSRRLVGLYPIVNAGPDSEPAAVAETLRAIAIAPVAAIQLRAKNVSVQLGRDLAEAAREVLRETPLIINDDVDCALAVGADGVHLGQGDGAPDAARKAAHDAGRIAFLVGVSTHNATQFSTAQRADVDYVAFGPLFESPTKRGHAAPLGLDALEAAAKGARHPVCTIGGLVDAATLCRAAAAGGRLGALISALQDVPDVTTAAHALCLAHHVGWTHRNEANHG